MKIVQLTVVDEQRALQHAVETLRFGGVIIFPTDTLYGLGADALSDAAVDKIYQIKGRDKNKPIHCVVSDIAMAQRYAEMNDVSRTLAEIFLPGPLTLILKKREGINSGIVHDIETIGIRIPNNEFCLALAREFNGPITATSANKSGEAPSRTIDSIISQVGQAAIMVDAAFDAGELPESLPSTVVDLSLDPPVLLREGALPIEKLRKYIPLVVKR